MSPSPAVAPLGDQNSMILGEMRGQLRELVHTVNNLSTKFDALTREVVALGSMATELAELRIKVATLEAEANQNKGARSFGMMVLKSPAIGWLVGAAISAWAVLTGKVHI